MLLRDSQPAQAVSSSKPLVGREHDAPRTAQPPPSDGITILFIEKHDVVRETVALYLSTEPGFAVLPPCSQAADAVAVAARGAPRVTIISISLPGDDIADSVRLIRSACADTHIIFLTANDEDELIALALQLKARGIVRKLDAMSELSLAIRETVKGGTYFSAGIRQRLIIDSNGIGLAKAPRENAGRLDA
jgi:DNA-binding NarL/FixJ family response regulator